MSVRLPVLCVTLLMMACPSMGPGPDAGEPAPDGGAAPDAGSEDGGTDGGAAPDAGTTDAGTSDAGTCTIAPVTITHTMATNPNTAHEHLVDPTMFPNAKCNDGSPAAYIMRPGVGAGAKRWILFLEGGGSCGNDVDCTARAKSDSGLMSSRAFTEGATSVRAFDGFKSSDSTVNPDFYDANFVLLHYCSSDQWSGDRDATSSNGITRFAFKGRAIADAIVRSLLPLGLASADEVILAGSSAGGLGLFVLVDDVRAQLPASIRLVALVDAAYALDFPDFDAATGLPTTLRPTPRQLAFISDITTWGGRGDRSCEAAATDDLGRAQCRLAAQLFSGGFLDVPVFVRQSQRDQVQLKLLGAGLKDAAADAYRLQFGAEMAKRLRATPAPASIFSTNDTMHGTADTALFNTSTINGVTMSAAIGAFYRNPCAQQVNVAP